MRTRQVIWSVWILAFAIILGACRNESAASSAPAAANVPVLTGSAVLKLEGVGSLTVKHPADWKVEVDQAIFMSNNRDANAEMEMGEGIPANTVLMQIAFIPTEIASLIGVEGEVTPNSVLKAFMGSVGSNTNAPAFGETSETTLGGKPAARVTGSNDKTEGVFIAVALDGGVAVVVGSAAKGNLATYQATVEAIAASAAFAKN